MKTYVTIDHTNATRTERRAIRENVVRELNELPENEFMQVQMMNNVMSAPTYMMQDPTGFGSQHMEIHRMVFESLCFRTLYWMETEVVGSVSFGFYHEVRSYCQIPEGTELSDIPMVPQGAMFETGTVDYHLSDEQYYRHRISELESRLNAMESERIILPREEIQAIHDGVRQCGDRPIPAEYFDETMFEVD